MEISTFEWEMVASKMLWMVSSEMWKEERRSSVNLLRFLIKSFTFTSEEYTKGKKFYSRFYSKFSEVLLI